MMSFPMSCHHRPLSHSVNGFAAACKPNLKQYRLAEGSIKCGAVDQVQLPINGGLDPELLPKHVALIFDGHRRWAISKDLSPICGYVAGVENLKKLALQFKNCGVKVVSVYLFSREYCWTRPKEEVDFLMQLFGQLAQKELDELMEYDVRLTFVGDTTRFPESMQEQIHSLVEQTKNNKGPQIVLAGDYSGRYDITQATRRIAGKVKEGVLQVEDINETVFEQHLGTNGLEVPNLDLLIRTGNKFDIGNYMLWQMAYTELHFSEKMFPDFNEDDVVEALAAYQRRTRCFGGDGRVLDNNQNV